MKSLSASVLGILSALIPAIMIYNLIPARGQDVITVLLAAVGTIYFGTALIETEMKVLLKEAIWGVVFTLLALLGWWYSPLLLALGWLMHAGGNLIRLWSKKEPVIRAKGFIWGCLAFDIVLFLITLYGYIL